MRITRESSSSSPCKGSQPQWAAWAVCLPPGVSGSTAQSHSLSPKSSSSWSPSPSPTGPTHSATTPLASTFLSKQISKSEKNLSLSNYLNITKCETTLIRKDHIYTIHTTNTIWPNAPTYRYIRKELNETKINRQEQIKLQNFFIKLARSITNCWTNWIQNPEGTWLYKYSRDYGPGLEKYRSGQNFEVSLILWYAFHPTAWPIIDHESINPTMIRWNVSSRTTGWNSRPILQTIFEKKQKIFQKWPKLMKKIQSFLPINNRSKQKISRGVFLYYWSTSIDHLLEHRRLRRLITPY